MTLYVPPHFRIEDPDLLFDFVQRHAFATMVSNGTNGMQVSHIPFVAERDAAGKLRLLGHVARANSHWQALEGAGEVLAIFQGPHGYVSPGWYQQLPAVPTWNYAVVHARGRASLMEEAELQELLMRLSAIYEDGRPRPWKMSEQPADFVSNLLKAIVGFAVDVERIEGKFKLSQNRPQEIPRVIGALEREEPALAAFMRAHATHAKE
ncbi:MAG: FMN-binding negative transcriptional regulator [Usitatibacter sp.]